MLEHAGSSRDKEVCGILIGYVRQAKGGWTCEVVDAIEGRFAREEAVSVTITHETWDHVHEVIDARNDDVRIVGWYHTHPGFGIFFSEHDAFIHTGFFTEPWQVGVVVDPISGDSGAFVGNREGSPQTLARYEVIEVGGARRVVECRYIADPVRATVQASDSAGLREAIERLGMQVMLLDQQVRMLMLLGYVATAGVVLLVAIVLAPLLLGISLRGPGPMPSAEPAVAPPGRTSSPAAPVIPVAPGAPPPAAPVIPVAPGAPPPAAGDAGDPMPAFRAADDPPPPAIPADDTPPAAVGGGE